MKKEDIILIGGGGHCTSVIDVIEMTDNFNIVGIIDLPEKLGQTFLGYKIIGIDEDLPKFAESKFFITIGQIKSSLLRARAFDKVKKLNLNLPSIISPLAYASKHSEILEGTILMHHSVVNAYVKIGQNAIINTGAIIEHEVIIGKHSHISTGTIVNGNCVIGDNCFIGSNSVVNRGVSISNNIIIGSGSVVTKSLTEPGTYVGTPPKRIR